MNLELKNVQIVERLSEETICFAATLYLDGIKIGTAENSGHGGPTSYRDLGTDKSRAAIKRAEAFFKAIPPSYVPVAGGESIEIEFDLEYAIDELIDKEYKKKEQLRVQKLLAKDMQFGIVVGSPDCYAKYPMTKTVNGKKVKVSVDEVLTTEKGKEFFINLLKKAQKELAAGEKILNTNIPVEILQAANIIL